MKQGEQKQFKATVQPTWSVSGNTSSNTTITQNGLLTVGEDEENTNIEVHATIGSTVKTANVTTAVRPYKQLEYIESTGTQFLNVGVSGASDVEIELSCRLISKVNNYDTLIASTNNTYRYQFAVYSDTTIYSYFYNSGQQNMNFSSTIFGKDMLLTFKNLVATIAFVNGETQSTTFTNSGDFDNGVDLCLFGRIGGSWGNWETPSCQQRSAMRVYYLKIWKGGELIKHYVPEENENGQIGLFDLVSGDFRGNVGTGTFIAGNPV